MSDVGGAPSLGMMPGDGQRRFFGAAGAGEGIRGSLISDGSRTSTPANLESYSDAPGGGPSSPIARDSTDISNAALGTPFLGFNHRDSSAMQSMSSADNLNKGEVEMTGVGGLAGRRDRMLDSYAGGGNGADPNRKRRKSLMIIGGLIGLLVIALAVGLGVGLSKKGGSSKKTSSGSGNGSGGNSTTTGGGPGEGVPTKGAVTGGNGSIVTTDDGTNFTYVNSFGGTWYSDPDDPFNMNAQSQSYVCFFILLLHNLLRVCRGSVPL